MTKSKLYEDASGNTSSSRVAGLTIIYSSIFFLLLCFIFAFIHPDQAASIIGIGSSLFTAMNVVACVYMNANKKIEIDKDIKLNTINHETN